MATATPSRAPARQRKQSRDEVARRLVRVLTDEPQSAVALAERLDLRGRGGRPNNELVLDAANVLFARRQARRIPNTAGSPQGGWVAWSSPLQVERPAEATEFRWPFKELKFIPVGKIGVDPSFQRPLTRLVAKIEREFDPEQFGVLILSDRGAAYEREHGWRYSAVDGQTRWVAAGNIGVAEAPSVVYTGLSARKEAGLFWRLQKNRRNAVSGEVFKARLAEGDEDALAVAKLVKKAGFEIGTDMDQIRSPAAVEDCVGTSPELTEDVLVTFKEAWPDIIPEGKYIKGLFFFCQNSPIDPEKRTKKRPPDAEISIDWDKLTERLKNNKPGDIDKKAISAKDVYPKLTGDKLYGMAFQAAYRGRAR